MTNSILVSVIITYNQENFIRESYRGIGYGKALLNTSIEILRAQGFVNYTLEVKKNNSSAFKLYQNYGFNKSKELEDSFLMTHKL